VNDQNAGTGASERIGNRALYTSFQLRASVVKNIAVALATQAQQLRLMVVIDRQPNGVSIATGDLLQFAPTPIESPRNLNFNKRFTMLHDRIYNVNPAKPTMFLQLFKSLRLNTTWTGGVGTLANVTQGSMYMVWWSDEPVGMDPPSVSVSRRLRWVG